MPLAQICARKNRTTEYFTSAAEKRFVFCFFAACAVEHAKSYSSGCEVSSCNSGWKVSDDKAKCVAYVCVCILLTLMSTVTISWRMQRMMGLEAMVMM